MQNKYPLWKYLLLGIVMFFAFIYALPNLYSEDPAIQISGKLNPNTSKQIEDNLAKAKISYKSIKMEDGNLSVRFDNTDQQLKAKSIHIFNNFNKEKK